MGYVKGQNNASTDKTVHQTTQFAAMPFCEMCGTQAMRRTAKFCASCGSSLDSEDTTSAPSTTIASTVDRRASVAGPATSTSPAHPPIVFSPSFDMRNLVDMRHLISFGGLHSTSGNADTGQSHASVSHATSAHPRLRQSTLGSLVGVTTEPAVDPELISRGIAQVPATSTAATLLNVIVSKLSRVSTLNASTIHDAARKIFAAICDKIGVPSSSERLSKNQRTHRETALKQAQDSGEFERLLNEDVHSKYPVSFGHASKKPKLAVEEISDSDSDDALPSCNSCTPATEEITSRPTASVRSETQDPVADACVDFKSTTAVAAEVQDLNPTHSTAPLISEGEKIIVVGELARNADRAAKAVLMQVHAVNISTLTVHDADLPNGPFFEVPFQKVLGNTVELRHETMEIPAGSQVWARYPMSKNVYTDTFYVATATTDYGGRHKYVKVKFCEETGRSDTPKSIPRNGVVFC